MQDVLQAAKNLGCVYNVTARVYDRGTGRLVSEHIGHNQATCSMMLGIAHYLQGDGILNQAPGMLSKSIPMYMSLGTMGLISQTADADGLPTGIGIYDDPEKTEEEQFVGYMEQLPGFGADGYDANENNDRPYFGLGPMYESGDAVNCELISSKFVRTPITYRAILPEAQAELPETIDIVFSAMISTGALAQFRNGSDHVFITELGLWSSKQWSDSVENGLLAGYRIIPSSSENWDMTDPDNRDILKRSILRVGKNQVVQVIWKIQLGSIEQFGGYVEAYRDLLEKIRNLDTGGAPAGFATLNTNGVVSDIGGDTRAATELLSGEIPLINSVRYPVGNAVGNAMICDAREMRCTTEYIYEIPAGKTATVSCAVSGMQITGWQMNDRFICTGNSFSTWQDFPLVIDNTNGSESMFVALNFRRPDNSDVSPSDFGTIMATLE